MSAFVEPEVWRKVPGWRLEVSDRGRVRNLAGRVLELAREKGTYRVRYRGSDTDPTARRMFTIASLVLHVFKGHHLTVRAIHIDGDPFNCALSNLKPGKVLADRSVLQYVVPASPGAADEAKRLLLAAGVSVEVVERALRGGRPDDWSDVDVCIRELDQAGMTGERIAQALGFLPRIITNRKMKMGLTRKPEHGETLPGEAWRSLPEYRIQVSSLGRVRGRAGLVKGSRRNGGRVRISITDESGRRRAVPISTLVLHAFRKAPLTAVAKHLNDDLTDLRLANLVEGSKEIIRPVSRRDTPWTKAQDAALRLATSWEEAARTTGHTVTYVKKRMAKLGIDLDSKTASRRGKQLPLHARDLVALQEAVEVLERMGIADRVINLGLRILPHEKGGAALALRAREDCVLALSDAGWSNGRISRSMGVRRTTVGRTKQRLGLTAPWPKGSSTSGGPVDPRQGEEWRDVPGLPYMVSNLGRVANSRGDLMAQVLNPANRYQVLLSDPSRSGSRYTALVSRLVLAAFKPELNARQAAYLNGDPSDIRPENLVPTRTLNRNAKPAVASAPQAPARGNLTGVALAPARGSVPFYEPIWAEARKLCPPGLEDHVREDLISDAVMLYLDGRAASMLAAFKLARREYNRTMGTWRETSLDAERGEGGFTLGHLLASDGMLVESAQAKSSRP